MTQATPQFKRFRNLRQDAQTREQHKELELHASDLVAPFFVIPGSKQTQPIESLTGVQQFTVDCLLSEVQQLLELGVDKVLLFGVVDAELKDERGSFVSHPQSPVVQAVKALKQVWPHLTVITDVCICAYTIHGHCGVVHEQQVLNDETLPILASMAVAHAQAGADFVAPSAMMDGQVWAIRQALNQHNLLDTRILSYSAKYSSAFYGPFRGAVNSQPSFGDRRSYQMDFRTLQQALDEVEADLEEGADAVMVKPAHTYLDIIQRVRQAHPDVLLAAYHVSGEYMLIKAAAEAGLVDEQQAMFETLYALKRAGAQWIITYYATQCASLLT